MGQALAIWSPVVVSKLDQPYHLQSHYNCALDQLFRSIEDLKIKVRTAVVRAQGLAVETLLRLDILCLVEDINGQLHLISREETVRNRIPLAEFSPEIRRENELKYVLDIHNIDCQGELRNQELHLDYFIDYMIIATRDQLVQLTAAESTEGQHSLREALMQLQAEVSRVENENRELRRRIYFYERDISSLKKGIRKAEISNSRLQQELNRYQEMIEQLQSLVRDKERRLQNLENPYYSSAAKAHREQESSPEEELPLGTRIKRLFVNNSS
ncbi:MAG TPA: hypothetical protein PLM20_05600 [Syntrophomonadaceae bacterium]|nr:hypothetical protein [Syntrophomonadaceae bacterium]HQA07010.1 hypothetical protein [Syntrophomonadaceae bacterium]HQE23359.1 hypothetical protein [Syntrophomonadaceae bacterium]